MENTPYIEIHLDKIERNANYLSGICRKNGIDVWGVTKSTLGDPEVGKAMLSGGCVGLADSRVENLERLRKSLPDVKLLCIRPPGLSKLERMIDVSDVSLQSDLRIIEEISKFAISKNKKHRIIPMVELGDLREGFMPDDFLPALMRISKLEGVEIGGIGGVLTCLSGVAPSIENMTVLLNFARLAENEFGIRIDKIAGGATNTIPMVIDSTLPQGINEFHVGEGIVLGMDVLDRKPIPGCETDTFVLGAEVIEVYEKPSVPTGEITQNVFGHSHDFVDKGMQKRAIINVGGQDTGNSLLTPIQDGVTLIDASSDHTVCDVTDVCEISVGDTLRFVPGYGALLHLMDSAYIEKRYIRKL